MRITVLLASSFFLLPFLAVGAVEKTSIDFVDPLIGTTRGGDYVLGAPQFPEVTFRLADGKTFTVVADGLSEENMFVKDCSVEGPVLKHADLVRGGTLRFTMGE